MTNTGVRLSGTNLERAADHNQRTVLHAIRVHRSITRVALAQISGLTPPAVANIVKRLIDDGLVMETGRLRQGRGQPGKVIAINPDARLSFGINVDRDHISFVLVNFLGDVIAHQHWEQDFMLPAEVGALWRDHAPAMLAEAKVPHSLLCGVGVGIPDDLGKIHIPGAPADYSKWSDADVTQLFAMPFDVPAYVENDATAAAMGEQQFGAGARYSSFIYLLISSGLGGALVVNGHIVRGANGRSGEIGLIPIGGAELVQDRVSFVALAQQLSAKDRVLADVFADMPDAICMDAVSAWIEGAVATLILPLVTANCIFNPAAILIGSRLPPPIVSQLAAALEKEMAENYAGLPSRAPVQTALLSATASAVGAALLPFIRQYLPNDDALWKNE